METPNAMEKQKKFCIIGGSGFYDFLERPIELLITTPFDSKPVTIYQQEFEEKILYFLPRHGGHHSIPPHKINFKANIYALHSLAIPRVIATSAVGSLRSIINPGDYVILDQFIDFVRPVTFFDGDFSVEFKKGIVKSGVIHLDMSEPYCHEIRKTLSEVLKDDHDTHSAGTYATTMGPRFETPAEIKALQQMGADVVGMTNSSEAILCRELGICYSVLAVVTNLAAGLQKQLSHVEVLDIFNSRAASLKQIFHEAISQIPETRNCTCAWYNE
jgi:5'-methylthioadenosine phosphorylase